MKSKGHLENKNLSFVTSGNGVLSLPEMEFCHFRKWSFVNSGNGVLSLPYMDFCHFRIWSFVTSGNGFLSLPEMEFCHFQNTTVFAQNTTVFSQNTNVFAQNTTVFAQNTPVFTQNTTVFAQNTTVFAKEKNCIWPKYHCICPKFNSRSSALIALALFYILLINITYIEWFGVKFCREIYFGNYIKFEIRHYNTKIHISLYFNCTVTGLLIHIFLPN